MVAKVKGILMRNVVLNMIREFGELKMAINSDLVTKNLIGGF